MRLVYVAGRHRDPSGWVVYQNTLDAERHAAVVTKIPSLVAVTPHLLTRNLDSLQSEQYWCEATMEVMRRCDAVFVVPGWEQSIGTIGEVREAIARRTPVFFEERALRLYAQFEGTIEYQPLLAMRSPWFAEQNTLNRLDLVSLSCRPADRFFVLNLRHNGEDRQDFGTLAWVVEVVSWLMACGVLTDSRPLFDWLDLMTENLETAKKK